ncbi:MAG TPA: DUF6515 family protein [Steroidobacteraceae bacterium]|nr:DUF6515 family protein [Steroidobacteraceae bacterium]
MTKSVKKLWTGLVLAGVMLGGAGTVSFAQHSPGHSGGHAQASPSRGGPNQHFDSRFSHNQYYYNRGYTAPRAPGGGAVAELHGRDGGRYRYHGGNWYRWGGRGWVVWAAPFGLFVPFLPPFYTTVWWGGIPYYYANDTYYAWNSAQQEYEVVAPPDGLDAADTSAIQQPPSDQLFVYPKNGQSPQQQASDRYECNRWAVQQSGFDPTLAGGGVPPDQAGAKRNDYFRAQVSCLEGRGYSVK